MSVFTNSPFCSVRSVRVVVASFSVAFLGSLPIAALAQDENNPAEACQEAIVLLEQNDIEGALEEARWCVEGIEQLKQSQTLSFFPEELNGYVGQELNQQKVMGMMTIERYYSGDSGSIKVSMTGGGAAATGLAALAKLGMDLGGDAATGKKMRVQRRTVYDSTNGNSVDFMAHLRSGGLLNFTSDSVSRDDTLAFIKAFPIKELDDALRDQ